MSSKRTEYKINKKIKKNDIKYARNIRNNSLNYSDSILNELPYGDFDKPILKPIIKPIDNISNISLSNDTIQSKQNIIDYTDDSDFDDSYFEPVVFVSKK